MRKGLIIVLGLGVVFGYGSAFARLAHRGHCMRGGPPCESRWDRGDARSEVAPPAPFAPSNAPLVAPTQAPVVAPTVVAPAAAPASPAPIIVVVPVNGAPAPAAPAATPIVVTVPQAQAAPVAPAAKE